MKDDDELCLCFHVTKRKVMQFIRVNQPQVPSQLSECFGAGTGCGWCRPFLKRLMEQPDMDPAILPESDAYADRRREYRQEQQ